MSAQVVLDVPAVENQVPSPGVFISAFTEDRHSPACGLQSVKAQLYVVQAFDDSKTLRAHTEFKRLKAARAFAAKEAEKHTVKIFESEPSDIGVSFKQVE